MSFEQQIQVPVHYKGVTLACAYRVDFLIERVLVLEVKAVERVLPVHEAQVITYLKLLDAEVGLLVNFHAETIKRDLRRLTLRRPSQSR